MAKICEQLREALLNQPGSLSQELKTHSQTCPECQAIVAALKDLKASRTGLSAKEATSVAAIQKAIGSSPAPQSTKSSLGKGIMITALAAVIGTGAYFFNSTAGQSQAPEKIYITSGNKNIPAKETQINLDSYKFVEFSPGIKAAIEQLSSVDVSSQSLSLIQGKASVTSENPNKTFVVKTPLAKISISGGSCKIEAGPANLKITVESGEIKVLQQNTDEPLTLQPGQEWIISPEQDTIEPVGTLLVSPDDEELK
jgi:hypothetical protein